MSTEELMLFNCGAGENSRESPGLQGDQTQISKVAEPAAPQGKLKNTGVGSLSLLQQIVPKHELNNGVLHCRQILYKLSYKASLLLV